MPNWCEGVLKVRGSKTDIKRFLIEGLQPIVGVEAEIKRMRGEDYEIPKAIISEGEWDFSMSAPYGFYIKGTKRAFIEGTISWYFEDNEDDDIHVLSIESFKQAWGIDAHEFACISEKFNIDFKIHGFERGMEFNQLVEIHKGEIIKDDEIEFDNYEWDCIFPNLGG